MGILDIDERKIRKAFEKARDESNITEGKLVLITEEYYDDALAFGRDVFTRDELLSQSFQVKWTPRRERYWKSVLQKKLSLMLVDEEHGEVMAIRTMDVVTAHDTFDTADVEDSGMKKLIGFLQYCRGKANIFETFGVGEAIQMHALGVDSKYRNRGLATQIFSAAVKMIQNLELDSVGVIGEGSSVAAKKIFERAGFIPLFDMPYDQYLIDGKQVIFETGGNTCKSETVYGLKLENNKIL